MSSTPTWVILVAPIAALLGTALGAALPRFFDRRAEAQARYDAAIEAVAALQAHRWGAGLAVPPDLVRAKDSEAAAQITQELATEGTRRFLGAAAEARAALAALHPWSPDLKRYWNKFEVEPAELDELISLLRERRRHPAKRHLSKAA